MGFGWVGYERMCLWMPEAADPGEVGTEEGLLPSLLQDAKPTHFSHLIPRALKVESVMPTVQLWPLKSRQSKYWLEVPQCGGRRAGVSALTPKCWAPAALPLSTLSPFLKAAVLGDSSLSSGSVTD